MTPTRRQFLAASAAPLLGTPPRRPTADRALLILMSGGPSQLDTFDPKPDAPVEVRGPFGTIPTRTPGVRVSELFPKLAAMSDRWSLIRSMTSDAPPVHELGWRRLTTVPAPDFGGTPTPPRPDPRPFPARLRPAGRLTVVPMFDTVFDAPSWDCHAAGGSLACDLGDYHDTVAPLFDLAVSTLLIGLHDRGLLDRTLVVATGEFGRTPKPNCNGGRDHWPGCWTTLIAGGGVRGGRVVGRSDATASAPADRPVTPAELVATISYAVGGPSEGEAVRELF